MNAPTLFVVRRQAALIGLVALLWIVPASRAQELKPIQLPKPQMTAGMPLMQALAERKTTRAFLDKPMPHTTIPPSPAESPGGKNKLKYA